ncbi:Serine incorporator 3 [Borealophlyctis nickersoniae]|nr:Serine incorporator 3 [Borealophlyctis nickersoniae]
MSSGSSGDVILGSWGSDMNVDDETTSVVYNYSFFHFSFALAAFYMASVLTNWDKFVQGDQPGQTAWELDKGVGGMWVKVATSWMDVVLYTWTLLRFYFRTETLRVQIGNDTKLYYSTITQNGPKCNLS